MIEQRTFSGKKKPFLPSISSQWVMNHIGILLIACSPVIVLFWYHKFWIGVAIISSIPIFGFIAMFYLVVDREQRISDAIAPRVTKQFPQIISSNTEKDVDKVSFIMGSNPPVTLPSFSVPSTDIALEMYKTFIQWNGDKPTTKNKLTKNILYSIGYTNGNNVHYTNQEGKKVYWFQSITDAFLDAGLFDKHKKPTNKLIDFLLTNYPLDEATLIELSKE